MVWRRCWRFFAQLRFEAEKVYTAEFHTVSGLENGNFVRIAGVEVGKVKNITIRDDNVALVDFCTDDLGGTDRRATRRLIRYDNLIGERYLALEEGAGGTRLLRPGDTIPLSRTAPALDLDAFIGGFRPLFRALDPDQVNALTGQLIEALQGQGATISTFLSQTAAVTNTLADRDELIGQVIVNLKRCWVRSATRARSSPSAVDSLSASWSTIAARKRDITQRLAVRQRAQPRPIGDLLTQARPRWPTSRSAKSDGQRGPGRPRLLRPTFSTRCPTPTRC